MKVSKKRKVKKDRNITFNYNGRKQIIRFDGSQFVPQLLNEGRVSGFEDGGYFMKIGGAIKKIIAHEISEEDEDISLLQFVQRYEIAVKEILSLEEDDLEF